MRLGFWSTILAGKCSENNRGDEWKKQKASWMITLITQKIHVWYILGLTHNQDGIVTTWWGSASYVFHKIHVWFFPPQKTLFVRPARQGFFFGVGNFWASTKKKFAKSWRFWNLCIGIWPGITWITLVMQTSSCDIFVNEGDEKRFEVFTIFVAFCLWETSMFWIVLP